MTSTNEAGSFWMPPQASTVAQEVDSLFDFIMDLNYIFFFLILAMVVVFVVRYRRTQQNQLATSDLAHNTFLEASWTFGPLALCLVMFVWGFKLFTTLAVAPEGAMVVNVEAQKWRWSFQYEDGQTSDELYVPAGIPVKLVMRSKDVLHSFFVPDFRVKADVIPNRYTTLWFEAIKPGVHTIYCTEYCGKDHSQMYNKVHVLSEDEFKKKKEVGFDAEIDPVTGKPKAKDPVVYGKELYEKKGCKACHSLEAGEKLVGPSFHGLFGRTGKTVAGETYTANEEYIRESVMTPLAKVVEGFPPSMPAFQGQINDEQMNALIAFIKTLK
jgi:cytochrome c oxidase subunit 2